MLYVNKKPRHITRLYKQCNIFPRFRYKETFFDNKGDFFFPCCLSTISASQLKSPVYYHVSESSTFQCKWKCQSVCGITDQSPSPVHAPSHLFSSGLPVWDGTEGTWSQLQTDVVKRLVGTSSPQEQSDCVEEHLLTFIWKTLHWRIRT